MTTEAMAPAGAGPETVAPDPVESPEVTTPETTAEQPQNDTAKPDEATDADKSLKRLQRRVDRVTAARYQAEAEARQLREQLARYQQQTQPRDEPQTIDPSELERFVSTRAQEIAQVETVAKRSNDTFNTGLKEFGDAFKSSVASVIDEAGPLIDGRGLPTALGEAVLESDAPAKLLHYLGQHPDIAESLQGLSAARLGRAIERIETQMASKSVSKAPAPLSPVKPAGTTAQKAAESMSDAEWYAARKRNR